MKATKPMLLIILLLAENILPAQVQWYQNQDGQNNPPYGTVATSVQPLNSTSFIACYLWRTAGEENTWKISKTSTGGAELKTQYVAGFSATMECRVSRNNTVYVFERSFTPDYSPLYKIYKLDANLNRTAFLEIVLPGGLVIYNMGVFQTDEDGNLYFAGDGQYPRSGGGYGSASVVLKYNKNLQLQWQRTDSAETSYTGLHIDRWGRVLLIEDHPSIFPQVRIKRFAYNGQPLSTFLVNTDASRFSLYSTLDNDDNILLYGGRTVSESSQSIFLKRISRFNGQCVYTRNHFAALSSQVSDLRTDRNGNIFLLSSYYADDTHYGYRVSRISLFTGNLNWNRVISFPEDSCILSRLVLNNDDHLYAIGEKRCHNYFSKGVALRFKKNGQNMGRLMAPDSVAFRRSHWLTDGMIDNSNKLIAVGSTTDVDTVSFSNQYFRSFAVKLVPGASNHNNNCNNARAAVDGEERAAATDDAGVKAEQPALRTQLAVFPNPAQGQLTISAIDMEEFDKLAVLNMQGAVLLQRKITGPVMKLDTQQWPDGVYILQLRSGNSLKEKTIKFVVSQ